ncbi:MAG: hypothetical protein COB12_02460 [Flavobacterium sp.]|nr:MAG: hypothetical protein COB12_02460 [Flavobacterium sp.]
MKIFLFILLIPFFGDSQELSFVEKIDLNTNQFIGYDSYNDLFYVKDQVLYKKTTSNLYNFKDFQLGEIYSVDIVNPMNIAVYYQDFNTVVLLDNKLTEIERVEFNNISEFTNTSQVTMAANNSLWIFNIDLQQLELYNYRSKIKTLVSQPINGEVLSFASNFNYCFVLTEEKIRAYNIYGSLLAEIYNEGFQKIVQLNENLIAIKDNELYYIDKETRESKKIKSPEITIKDLQLTQEFLYIYDENQVQKFTITLPK